MKIFILKPVNATDPIWRGKRVIERVVVRALTEGNARLLAKKTFNGKLVATLRTGNEHIPSPWLERKKVSCAEINDLSYPIDGPEEILFPK